MSWSHPNELGLAHGYTRAGGTWIGASSSDYHRRVRRLIVDAESLRRGGEASTVQAAVRLAVSRPTAIDAMSLAVDRDRLLDDFRD